MAPFYLILITYPDGQRGASDPQETLDAAADEFGEAEKPRPASRAVLLIDTEAGKVADVTRRIEAHIAARMNGRSAA